MGTINPNGAHHITIGISHGDMISRNLGSFHYEGKGAHSASYEGFALMTGYGSFAMSTFLIMRLIVPQVYLPR